MAHIFTNSTQLNSENIDRPYLQLDEVLLAVDDGELTLLVELPDVAGLEPALPARGVLQKAVPREIGHVVVPLGDGITAQPHLACVTKQYERIDEEENIS